MRPKALNFLAAAGRPARLASVGRRQFFLAVTLLIIAFTQQPVTPTGAASPTIAPGLVGRAAERIAPQLNLARGYRLPATYSGPADLTHALQSNQARPLTLAAADFDEDGAPDLVSGYATESGGLLTVQRGNGDALYPRSPPRATPLVSHWRKTGRQRRFWLFRLSAASRRGF